MAFQPVQFLLIRIRVCREKRTGKMLAVEGQLLNQYVSM